MSDFIDRCRESKSQCRSIAFWLTTIRGWLARNRTDVLSLNDRIRYQGAFIYAVAQRLDCREKTSRPLLTLHGMAEKFPKLDVIDLRDSEKTIQDEARRLRVPSPSFSRNEQLLARKPRTLLRPSLTIGTRRRWALNSRRSNATIDETLGSANQPLDLAYSLDGVREFAATKLMDLLVDADINRRAHCVQRKPGWPGPRVLRGR